MIQEEKQLLLKDLCARLPYGVRVKLNGRREKSNKLTIDWLYAYSRHIEDIKPYLRPMSSMTEEELKWYYNKLTTIEESRIRRQKHIEELNNWLNAHHFDYRGLIEKGLALEALEGMYNI